MRNPGNQEKTCLVLHFTPDFMSMESSIIFSRQGAKNAKSRIRQGQSLFLAFFASLRETLNDWKRMASWRKIDIQGTGLNRGYPARFPSRRCKRRGEQPQRVILSSTPPLRGGPEASRLAGGGSLIPTLMLSFSLPGFLIDNSPVSRSRTAVPRLRPARAMAGPGVRDRPVCKGRDRIRNADTGV